MSSRTVARRIASGELVRLLPGVYSGPDPTYAERIVAVSLWKPCAVLSHDTAAWLWGLLPDEPSHVHATLPPTPPPRVGYARIADPSTRSSCTGVFPW